MEKEKKTFSENLKKYLDSNGMTHSELAEKIGVDRATVTQWCSGRYFPRIDKVEQIADVFGCNAGDLISGSPDTRVDYLVEEKNLIETYRTLNINQKQALKKYVAYLKFIEEIK